MTKNIKLGGIYRAIISYYDAKRSCLSFKPRPVLIIGRLNARRFVVLPFTTMQKKQYLDKKYDIEIDPRKNPEIALYKAGYVQTNYTTVVDFRNIDSRQICDLSRANKKLYSEILDKWKQSGREIMRQNIQLDKYARSEDRDRQTSARRRDEEAEKDYDDDRDNGIGY